MVFGADGQQLPHLQGLVAQVRPRLVAAVPEAAWWYGIFPGSLCTDTFPADPAWLAGRAARILARARADGISAYSAPSATGIARRESRIGRFLVPPFDLPPAWQGWQAGATP